LKRSGDLFLHLSDRRVHLTILLACLALALAAASPALAQGTGKAAYILIHKDGYRIDASEKPVVEGDSVKVRLFPTGLLTTISASKIDWEATEKINAQGAQPAPRSTPPPKARSHSGKVIEKTIRGSKIMTAIKAADAEAEASSAASADGSARAAAGARAVDPEMAKSKAASNKAARERELANLRSTRASTQKEKTGLEQQIARLQAKVANEPGASSVQAHKSASRAALEKARVALVQADARLRTLRRRIAEVEYQGVIADVD
jgi:hypothetical protein